MTIEETDGLTTLHACLFGPLNSRSGSALQTAAVGCTEARMFIMKEARAWSLPETEAAGGLLSVMSCPQDGSPPLRQRDHNLYMCQDIDSAAAQSSARRLRRGAILYLTPSPFAILPAFNKIALFGELVVKYGQMQCPSPGPRWLITVLLGL